MKLRVRQIGLRGWQHALAVCCTGLSVAWTGPDTLPAKKPASKPVSAETAPAKQDGAAAGPGLAIGPNTNYSIQVPAISIESSSPVMCNVRKPMEHQILVKNIGSMPAEQVEVRAVFSIPSSFLSTQPKAEVDGSTLTWRLPRLDANAQQKLTVQLKPLTTGELSCTTSVVFASSSSLKVQVGEPKLKLVCEGPKDTQIGYDVHLLVTVTNAGTGTASSVRIRQDQPDVIRTGSTRIAMPAPVELGTLEPGESRFVETLLPAREPGTVRAALVAECEDGLSASIDHVVKVRAPKLELTASGPEFRYLNRKATYQYALKNPGDAIALNANLVVAIPDGLQFVEATSGGLYNQQKGTVEWLVGMIEAGKMHEFGVTVMAKTEGEHLQRTMAWADNGLRASADKIIRIGGTPSVVMEVVNMDDPIEVGSITDYEIRIANRGTKAAENVQVMATVPEGMEVVAATGTKYRIDGKQIIFEALPSLEAKTASRLKVKVRGVKSGTVLFRAELTSPSLGQALTAQQATEVYGE